MGTKHERNISEALLNEWDRLLLNADLFVSDPKDQKGLIERIPEGVLPIRPINSYHTGRATGKKTDCAQCGHKRNHFRGMTVELDDGNKALVGYNCGEADFGKDVWHKLQNDLERRQRLVLYRTRIEPYRRQFAACLNEIEKWLPSAELVDAFFDALKEELPPLYKALVGAAEKNAGLTRSKTVRRQVVDAIGRQQEITDHQIEQFGTVPAALMITGTRLRTQLRQARYKIKQLDHLLAEADGPQALLDLEEASRGRTEVRRALREAARQHWSAIELTDRETLQRVANWATKDTRQEGKYKVNKAGLIFRPTEKYSNAFRTKDKGALHFSVPKTLPPPVLSAVDALTSSFGSSLAA